jgi:1,4-dihydroxy-2-naphthoate octaprenyltransferase
VLGALALGGALPAGALIAFLTLPRAIDVTRIVLRRDEARALNTALRQTAGLHLQFGLLLSAALLASTLLT